MSEDRTTLESEWLKWSEECLGVLPDSLLEHIAPLLKDAFFAGAVSVMTMESMGITSAVILSELTRRMRETSMSIAPLPCHGTR